MTVRQRFPPAGEVAVGTLLAEVSGVPTGGPLVVGDERIREFLVAFGRRLLAPAVARRHPELAAAGFFLRRGRLAAALADLPTRPGVLRFPRGLVFHLPPANVDSMMLYSWALAAVAGNHNVVRVSPRSGRATEVAMELLGETLDGSHPAVAQTQRMVTYGRDEDTTAALSAACELRVIWGGDESVAAVRRVPLRPAARELTFPHRTSFGVLSAESWRTASLTTRRALAEGLYNDVYWFDQAACASPRAIFVVGTRQAGAEVRDELAAHLAAVVAQRRPPVEPAMAVEKYVAAYGLAAQGVVARVETPSNALTHVDLVAGQPIPREWLGAGMFVWARVDRLTDLVPLLGRGDQTLAYFGFDADELTDFVRRCGGRAVDRVVPIGQALDFSPVWDGVSLLHEFTRLTTVTV